MREGYSSSTTENNPQQIPQCSVQTRAQHLENLLNKAEAKPQPGGRNLRPLPVPPTPLKAESKKEAVINKQNQPQNPPPRPRQSPPSREIRHNCQKAPSSGHVRILAIDGGGVRGLIPAIVVAQLEKDLGLSITKIFDIFVGNSAGGMLALILTKPGASQQKPAFTASEVVEKIKDLSAKMFGGVQKSTLSKAKATVKKTKNLLATGAKYNPEILEKLSTELCGNITLSQAVKPVYIPTFDLESERTLILSTPLAKRSKLFDFKMADVARATSAAPFYFPIHPLEFTNNEIGTGLKMQLIDGGVGSNNPTLIGLMEASKEYCTAPAYEVLSLGTRVLTKESIQ